MNTEHNILLTSSEMSVLWSLYMADTMGLCILKYFLEKVEDTEIRPVLKYAEEITKNQIEKVTKIFQEEKIPMPYGFTEDDVDPTVPRLYSDVFFIRYLKQQAEINLATFGAALALSTRADIRDFFSQCLSSIKELFNKASDVMASKGVLVRAPLISKPEKVEYIQKQSFLDGFFGK
jgi:hypothetical protein